MELKLRSELPADANMRCAKCARWLVYEGWSIRLIVELGDGTALCARCVAMGAMVGPRSPRPVQKA